MSPMSPLNSPNAGGSEPKVLKSSGALVVATFYSTSPVLAQTYVEETWDVDTIEEADGTTSYIFSDSVDAEKEVVKKKCTARKRKIVAMNVPDQAVCAFREHALGHGCSSNSPLSRLKAKCDIIGK